MLDELEKLKQENSHLKTLAYSTDSDEVFHKLQDQIEANEVLRKNIESITLSNEAMKLQVKEESLNLAKRIEELEKLNKIIEKENLQVVNDLIEAKMKFASISMELEDAKQKRRGSKLMSK